MLNRCPIPMPWFHVAAFKMQAFQLNPDQFEDLSPPLHKSDLTKPSSSWPASPAWTPGPIPGGAQAAAFPIVGED